MSNFLTPADPNCYLDRIRNSRDILPLARELEQVPARPINQTGAFAEYVFDLSGNSGEDIVDTVGVLVSSPGFELHYLREGSAPGGRLDLEVGGRITSFAPGQGFRGYFDSFRVKRNTSSGTSGNARLLVVTSPNVAWMETPSDAPSSGGVQVSSVAQNYNQTNNSPSAATDGLSLVGARGARVLLDCGNGNTFNTGVGSVVLWYYSTDAAAWFEGRTQLAIPSNSLRRAGFDDMAVVVPYGRIYAEVRSATHSGGAGAITSYLEVY